jgi:hypothetical protein
MQSSFAEHLTLSKLHPMLSSLDIWDFGLLLSPHFDTIFGL